MPDVRLRNHTCPALTSLQARSSNASTSSSPLRRQRCPRTFRFPPSQVSPSGTRSSIVSGQRARVYVSFSHAPPISRRTRLYWTASFAFSSAEAFVVVGRRSLCSSHTALLKQLSRACSPFFPTLTSEAMWSPPSSRCVRLLYAATWNPSPKAHTLGCGGWPGPISPGPKPNPACSGLRFARR